MLYSISTFQLSDLFSTINFKVHQEIVFKSKKTTAIKLILSKIVNHHKKITFSLPSQHPRSTRSFACIISWRDAFQKRITKKFLLPQSDCIHVGGVIGHISALAASFYLPEPLNNLLEPISDSVIYVWFWRAIARDDFWRTYFAVLHFSELDKNFSLNWIEKVPR